MLVRTYRSPTTGREFPLHQHEDGSFVCTCKEYRGNLPWSRICRHVRAFLAEQAKPNPFDSLDWL